MRYIIGIDEVGRGPLAGPIAVGAFLAPAGFRVNPALRQRHGLPKLKDSKRLRAKARELWFKWLREESVSSRGSRQSIAYAVCRVYPKQIDRLNIYVAANLAAFKSFSKLLSGMNAVERREAEVRVYLDGGLYLKNKDVQAAIAGNRSCGIYIKCVRTVIAGDEKLASIKIASIAAKVSRDRYMSLQHKKYPVYGFAGHKGYGTRAHFIAISEHGPCPIHRLTFLKKYNNINPKR